MTPADLLSELLKRGLTVTSDGDRLVVRPASRLSADEQADVRTHAAAIVALLREERERPPDQLVVETLTADGVLRDLEAAREAHERRVVEAEIQAGHRRANCDETGRRVEFRLARGVIELRNLRPDEVRRLEQRGLLTPAEVRQWARSRRAGNVVF